MADPTQGSSSTDTSIYNNPNNLPVAGSELGNSNTGSGGGSNSSSGGGFDPKYLSLAALVPMLVNLFKGNSPGQMLGSIPGGQDLMNNMVTTSNQQQPLRTAVIQSGLNMLPSSSFSGGVRPSASSGATATYAPASSSSSSSDLMNVLGLLGAGAGGFGLAKLLSSGSGGSGSGGGSGAGGNSPLSSLLNKLFGGGNGSGIQGNQPNAGGVAPSIGSTFLPNNSLMFPAGYGFNPSDPSGGTGVGPGMQNYYNSGVGDANGMGDGSDGSDQYGG